ncbi:MAG: peptidylprolyl isomerase [Betaproteobacteria bacterium]|nr:peptidylprolyl isomerase [Betaproteobacteria bacterium]
MAVQQDSFLTLHYRISLVDAAEPVMSTFGDRPATIQMGAGQLAHALEQCLLGLEEGDRRLFQLADGQAFGPRNPQLLQRLKRALVDKHSDRSDPVLPGDLLDFPRPDGGRYAGVVKEINQDFALIDFNHPLAGQAIDFEVELISVL